MGWKQRFARGAAGAATLMLAAQAPALVGTGQSPLGVLETMPPAAGSLTVAPLSTAAPLTVSYSGAGDAGTGLLSVELWFRTLTGVWTPSGLTQPGATGSFSFTPPDPGPGPSTTLFFQLVATDQAGNTSTIPAGSVTTGQGTTSYEPTSSVENWWMLQ